MPTTTHAVPALDEQALRAHGFHLERSAIYGMQPRASWLLDLGR